MFIFGANHHRVCSGLDMVGRQFVFGANPYRSRTGRDMGGRAPLIDCTTTVCRRSYLAPTFTELVADSTWTGASDRLYY